MDLDIPAVKFQICRATWPVLTMSLGRFGLIVENLGYNMILEFKVLSR